MVAGIKTQTQIIKNGDDVDAIPIEQIHEDLYGNDSLLSDAIDQINQIVSSDSLSASTISESVTGRGVEVQEVLINDGKARLISITNTITGTSNGSTVFGTPTNHNLTTGQPIKFAAGPGSNLDGNVSEGTIYYARVLTSKTFSIHSNLADATAGTNAIAVTTASTGKRYLVSTPASVREGQIFTNADGSGVHVVLGGNIQDLVTSDVYGLLTRFSGTKTPLYANATTFTVNRISERDSTNNVTMTKSSSTTLNIATTGLNGIAQSSNLTGTVTVTSGSTSLIFSASQTGALIPNDILTTAGGQSRKIVSVAGTTATVESQFQTTETAVTFKRGGRANFYTSSTSGTVGTAHYYLYAISDGTNTNLILSTRNVAKGESLIDLPANYQYSKLLPFAVTLYNTSTAAGVYVGNLVPFRVGTGWPYRPEIFYGLNITLGASGGPILGDANVVNAGQITTNTTIDAGLWVPPISRLMIPSLMPYGRPSSYIFKETGTANYVMSCGDFNGGNVYQPRALPVNATGQFDYQGVLVTGALYVDVVGYIVTETF